MPFRRPIRRPVRRPVVVRPRPIVPVAGIVTGMAVGSMISNKNQQHCSGDKCNTTDTIIVQQPTQVVQQQPTQVVQQPIQQIIGLPEYNHGRIILIQMLATNRCIRLCMNNLLDGIGNGNNIYSQWMILRIPGENMIRLRNMGDQRMYLKIDQSGGLYATTNEYESIFQIIDKGNNIYTLTNLGWVIGVLETGQIKYQCRINELGSDLMLK